MNNMEKLEKSKKPTTSKTISIIMVVGAILIFGVGYFFYVKPAADLAAELNSQDILTLELELGQKQNRLLNAKKLAKTYENPSDEILIKLNEALPSEPDEVNLFVNLTSLIELSGLEVKNIEILIPTEKEIPLALQLQDGKAASKVKEVKIKVSADGMTYTNLKRFIRNIESNSRLLRLDELTFIPSSSNYNTDLTAYYLEN
jgi:Tfp pilus assembly protein PilO